MAIEVFPDSPTLGMSPRISFSHDLSQTDVVPVEQYSRSGSSTSFDFDFCVFRGNFDVESSADELFFNGKILPIEIKKRLLSSPETTHHDPAAANLYVRPQSRAMAFPPPQPLQKSKTAMSVNEPKFPIISESEEKHQTTCKSSFWSFKRSTSLNCGSGYARTLCPLPLLSRSNSTGSSTTSSKRTPFAKHNILRNTCHHKQPNSSSSSSTTHQKPPLKKNHNPYCSNGIKINPVLNVSTVSLFGFGSIFSTGKDKNKKKY